MTKVTDRGIKKEPFTYLQYTGGAGGTLEWVTPLLSSPILLFTKEGRKRRGRPARHLAKRSQPYVVTCTPSSVLWVTIETPSPIYILQLIITVWYSQELPSQGEDRSIQGTLSAHTL